MKKSNGNIGSDENDSSLNYALLTKLLRFDILVNEQRNNDRPKSKYNKK